MRGSKYCVSFFSCKLLHNINIDLACPEMFLKKANLRLFMRPECRMMWKNFLRHRSLAVRQDSPALADNLCYGAVLD